MENSARKPWKILFNSFVIGTKKIYLTPGRCVGGRATRGIDDDGSNRVSVRWTPGLHFTHLNTRLLPIFAACRVAIKHVVVYLVLFGIYQKL
jgi:hypothetical protein